MKAQTPSFNTIVPFCKDNKPLYLKFILLSTQKMSFSYKMNATLLFIEYFQLLSQIFLFMSHLQSQTESSGLNRAIRIFANAFSPGNIMISEGSTAKSCLWIMAPFTVLFLIKCSLLINCIFAAGKDLEEDTILLKAWRFIVKSHSRVGYFLWTSFYTRIIYLLSNDSMNEENSFITGWAVAMIVLEFVLALMFQIFFSYSLPTKDFLASKSNTIEILTLLQKIIVQILEINSISFPDSSIWVFALIGCLFSLARDALFFLTLPFYKTKALLYQLLLLIPITCLNLAYLVFGLIRLFDAYGDIEINSNPVLITWLVLTVLAIKIGLSDLDNIFSQLVISSKKYPSKILIHKVILIKKLIKQSYKGFESCEKSKWSYLLRWTCTNNVINALGITDKIAPDEEINLQSKAFLNRIFVLYLETLVQKYPRDNLLKLYLAYLLGKKCHLIGLSMAILINLKRHNLSIFTKLIVYRVIHEIQLGIIAKQKAENDLDIHCYIKNVSAVDRLKETMLNQAKLQIKLYHEVIQSTPNLPNICSYSQSITQTRCKIERLTRNVLKSIPEYSIEPLKLLAHYNLTLNHSMEAYDKYLRDYTMKSQKYKQMFNQDKLCEENIYQKENMIFMVSGKKEDLSTIVYRSLSSINMLGYDPLGAKSFTLAQPAMQKIYQHFFQIALERGDTTLSGKIALSFYYNQEGFTGPTYYYLEISPFLSENLYYFIVIRKLENHSEFIVLNEDGTIDSCTKKAGSELGYLPLPAISLRKPTHISLISKELEQMNQAFNMILLPEKYNGMNNNDKQTSGIDQHEKGILASGSGSNLVNNRSSVHRKRGKTQFNTNLSPLQAKELYSAYTTEGKDLSLASIRHPDKSFLYNCKVQTQLIGDLLLKTISLEKLNDSKKTNEEVPVPKPCNVQSSTIDKLNLNAEANTELDDWSNEDEKADGWIDFQRLDSVRCPNSPSYLPEKNEPLSSTRQDLPSSTRNLLTTQGVLLSPLKSRLDQSLLANNNLKNVKVPAKKIIDIQQSSWTNNEPKNLAKQTKIAKAFIDATNTKHYPKFYTTFLLLWYILLGGILANQFRLSISNTNRVEDLQANKNVMRVSNSRSDALISVHLYLRSYWKLIELDPTGSLISDIAVTVTLFGIDSLRDINQEMMLATTTPNWFFKDIKIYDEDYSNFVYSNSFQAIDRIVSSSYKAVLEAKTDYRTSLSSINFVLRNSLNDLLTKSDQISDEVWVDITEKNDKSRDDLNVSLWITITIVIIMAIYFVTMVYMQHKTSTQHLLALTKIRSKEVENVMKRIIQFQKSIEEDIEFKENANLNDLNVKLEFQDAQNNAKNNKGKSYSSGYKGISRRFWLYGIQTIFLLLVIITIILVNQIMLVSYIKTTEKMLTRMDFTNDANLGVSLIITLLFEFLVSPNTTNSIYVNNNPIQEEMTHQLQVINDLITGFPEYFPQGDLDNDPAVREIIYEDSCKYVEDDLQTLCPAYVAGSMKKGIIEVLSDLELYVQTTLASNTYITSYIDQLNVIIKDLSLRSIFASLLNLFNQGFDKILDETVRSTRILNGTIISSLVIVCVVVHVFVLKRIGESDNNFKKILQSFPGQLILSNFLLKSFLLKSSKDALSAVKDDI